MKFTCTQENFAQALAVVSRVASKNVALPILHNVLLIADKGGVQLQTTNLEVAVTVSMRAKVENEGRYTVPSRVLSDFITLLGHEKVTLTTTDQGLEISSGHSTTTLKGVPADDFPVLPQPTEVVEVKLPSSALYAAISETVFAAANDESRPEISGVFCQVNNDTLTIAATDSYRLSERHTKLTSAAQGTTKAIIPSRTIHELLRLLPRDETEVALALGDNHARCRWPEVEMVSRVIDGQYPDYQQIVPSESLTTATLPREEFLANIRAASLFCKPGINDITLSIHPSDKKVTIAAANAQLGEHQADVNGTITGQEVEIIFNHRYLIDGLSSFSGDEVELHLTNNQAPAVIRRPKHQDGLYLIMPIRQ